jgi:glutathione S-transferase
MTGSSKGSSSERRITVHGGVYAHLQEWAARDRLTVADVANAILLQAIRPYGVTPDCHCAATLGVPAFHPAVQQRATPGQQTGFDPYATAAVDTW